MPDGAEAQFSASVNGLSRVIGHADRVCPPRDDCTGPMLPSARKSEEPLAVVTAPALVSAQHRRRMHFVS